MKPQLIFIGGLHRSGTSLTHEILRTHPEISGITSTNVHRDEGQHLQSVYKPASSFGGMARFGFNKASFMDETHPLATPENAETLLREWGAYWDSSKPYAVEKSPPNLVRSRFLQKLFPGAKFVFILRHPVAVAYAAKKWSRMPFSLILEHNLRCYEKLKQDLPYLHSAYIFRYEDFVVDSQKNVRRLLEWLDVEPIDYPIDVKQNVNGRYFADYRASQKNLVKKLLLGGLDSQWHFETRSHVFGYSIKEPEALLPISWLGPQQHTRSANRPKVLGQAQL